MSSLATVIAPLKAILASNYTLYTKTQNFHWNVVGSHFYTLHKMFEEQYTDLAIANDEIAEHIRALGSLAPGTHKAFDELSFIDEQPEQNSAQTMVTELLADHETMINHLSQTIGAAGRANDDGTADMLTSRLKSHQKIAWMLRSFLESS